MSGKKFLLSYFRYKETKISRSWVICPSSQVIICIAISDSILSNHKLHAPSHHAYVNSYSAATEAQGEVCL